MATYVSFLSTIQGFATGLIDPSPHDRFAFNCRRSRVFPPDDGIPGYVSRMNELQPHHPNTTILQADDLHPKTLAIWEKLKPMLERAEVEGRIVWATDEAGNPQFNLYDLHEDTPDAVRFKPRT